MQRYYLRARRSGVYKQIRTLVISDLFNRYSLERSKSRFLDLPDDAENPGEDPSHGTGLRVGAGLHLTLTMGADHLDRVRPEVGGVDVLDDHGLA